MTAVGTLLVTIIMIVISILVIMITVLSVIVTGHQNNNWLVYYFTSHHCDDSG
jgi:uncharacterized membrane protein YqiK